MVAKGIEKHCKLCYHWIGQCEREQGAEEWEVHHRLRRLQARLEGRGSRCYVTDSLKANNVRAKGMKDGGKVRKIVCERAAIDAKKAHAISVQERAR